MARTLNDIKEKEETTVVGVTGDSNFVCQMYELGVLPGTRLHVELRAPLSGPLYLRAPAFSFFMRRTEAQKIICR